MERTFCALEVKRNALLLGLGHDLEREKLADAGSLSLRMDA